MIYSISGVALASAYSFNGVSINKAYDVSGNEVFSGELPGYETYPEAIQYAYQRMMNQYDAENTVPFALFSDNHSNINSGRIDFFATLKNIADWTKLWMIDMGDTTNLNSYAEVQSETSGQLQNVIDKMNSANIPENRRMQVWGNHDMWAKDSENVTYALTDHSWMLSMYFKNTGASRYYDNDFVMFDTARSIKFIAIGGWDFDSNLGGHSHYVINGEHMESIITMLSVVDNYDIVLLSHVTPFRKYSSIFGYNEENDGVGAIGEPTAWSTSATYESLADCSIDELIQARKNHTSGTVKDSYNVSHSYDFTGCNGDILCALSGHWHKDAYGYSLYGGILHYVFDCYYQAPKGFYLGLIDKENAKLKLWKIDQVPVVYEYEQEFEEPSA